LSIIILTIDRPKPRSSVNSLLKGGRRVIEEFRTYRLAHHQAAIAWKEQNRGKVLGTFCCCVPEEIIHAAGMLPVRVLGEHEETTEADLHFPTNLCLYCKSCFDQALRGGQWHMRRLC